MFKDKMSDGTVRLTGGKSAGGGGGGGGWTPKNFDEVLSSITGKVHHWKFNETSGSMVADSVGSLPLTMSGTYTRNSDLSPSGRPSTYFSGTGSKAVSSGIGSVPIGESPRTLIIFTKSSSYSRSFPISYGVGSTNLSYILEFNNDNERGVSSSVWNDAGDLKWVNSGSVSDNGWHMVATAFDGDRSHSLYRDGDQISKRVNTDINTLSSDFYVGAFFGGGFNFSGHISDVIVFDRCLSKNELDSLYDSTKHKGSSSSGGAGGSPVIKDKRWFVPPTEISIDEFNSDTMDPAWTRVDKTGGVSRAKWTQGAGVLSVLNEGGDAAAELHALMRPIENGMLNVGDAFVTSLAIMGDEGSGANHIGGILLSDQIVPETGYQQSSMVWTNHVKGEYQVSPFSFMDFKTSINQPTSAKLAYPARIYLRLVKTDSDKWRSDYSPDGVSWLKGSVNTFALTPIYVGFFSTSWLGYRKSIISYEFLRRQSGVS